jgi:hypothetical protein
MEVGNMEDINNMALKDFNNLLKYLSRRNKIREGKPVPLKESQKEMIKITKEKNKKE